MTRCLTKMNNSGFTLTEMMIAVAFTVFLMAGVYGFYTTSSQDYSAGISGQALQDGADLVLGKIIAGETEPGGVFRLGTAISYMIPNGAANALYSCGGAPQVAPCNFNNPSGELYYCQDTPCTGANDATARWYYLNNMGTSVIYHHNGQEENIYSAPAGSTFVLRFAPILSLPNDVEIDVALTQNVSMSVTNSRLNTNSGSASTYVLLRDHP